jgi:hypothetical protein
MTWSGLWEVPSRLVSRFRGAPKRPSVKRASPKSPVFRERAPRSFQPRGRTDTPMKRVAPDQTIPGARLNGRRSGGQRPAGRADSRGGSAPGTPADGPRRNSARTRNGTFPVQTGSEGLWQSRSLYVLEQIGSPKARACPERLARANPVPTRPRMPGEHSTASVSGTVRESCPAQWSGAAG